ncbi:MAG: peptide chain release factor N(5)-glutamine methyltransferase [Eubacterium sp.]|nr:peptide chain release factor N(5)-glutamine methyltransferase [Eubacterium sp.]
MTLQEGLFYGEKILEEAGVSDSKQDAWLLFAHVTGFDKVGYLMHADEEFYAHKKEDYVILLKKRAEHIPVQYILGEQEFMGLPIKVTQDVLIPRLDTEVIASEAARLLKGGERVLDLCTGSGCILISLLHEVPDAVGIGADISKQAVNLAMENAAANGVAADFIVSDLFENISGSFDMIVSNPPYIPTADMYNLMPEVRDYEPSLALDGGEDGLDYYRRIVAESPDYLKDGGLLILEIGCDQAAGVKFLMEQNGFYDISVIKDLPGLDRVVMGRTSHVHH